MFSFLYRRIDNAPLIAFRILFGLLMSWHCCKTVLEGTIYRYFILPKHTLTFIGFDWLQPLPGKWMYAFNTIMALFAFGIAVGYKYRVSVAAFTVMWTAEYLMQKSWYNNHYYLVILLCIFLFIVPANKYASIDSRKNPSIGQNTMPYWCVFIFIFQIAIVYFFAAIAKLYPDWLSGAYIEIMLTTRDGKWLGPLLHNKEFHKFIAMAGFLFDLLIVPLLLFKRTRLLGTLASVCFHIFNSVVLHIGIFPYLSLAFLVFFYPPELSRRIFFKDKTPDIAMGTVVPNPNDNQLLKYFLLPYFIIQLVLPIRHHFIKGNVLWTEEGYRLSWMMMMKNKKGETTYKIRDNKTKKEFIYDLESLLTKNQARSLKGRPDMIWQTAQLIKKEFDAKGRDVSIFVTAKAGINAHEQRLIVDPNVDFAKAGYNYFGHDDWIILYDDSQLFN